MRNYIRPGNTIPATAPAGGVSSGDPFAIGSLVGVAAFDAAAGQPVEARLTGVYSLPKAAVVMAQGAGLYFDAEAGAFTTEGEGNIPAGSAFRAAAELAEMVEVLLIPSAPPVVPPAE